MAIADHTAYSANLARALRLPLMMSSSSIISGQLLASLWRNVLPVNGVVPSTAVAPDYSSAGALGQVTSAGFRLLLTQLTQGFTAPPGALMIADRLSHQGGLSGTVSPAAQTTNLPTAALTRSTTGVGVMAAIEMYTTIGASGGNVTLSYTNSAGTAGRTSKERALGFSGPNTAGVLSIVPLADGDVGVKSVESVTLSASSGTAGNFGVTLFKPYCVFTLNSDDPYESDAATALGCLLPLIPKDACLFPIALCALGTTPLWQGSLLIAED